MEPTYLIIGGGQAGGRAAETLRNQGVTGRVVIVGDESCPPYERPPLSKEVLTAPSDETCFNGWLHEAVFYQRAAIEQLEDRVTRLDTALQIAYLASGEQIHYDKCLIATGGRARMLSDIAQGERVLSLRTLSDALRLRKLLKRSRSVAVIGGGFLGLEFAASARARGLEVTVFEMAPRLLGKAMPAAFSQRLAAKHLALGVKLKLETGPISVVQRDDGVTVNAGTHTETFDFCVLAVGQTPNDDVARASGIEVSNGIVVDACCRTSAPNVFAAGDCANFPFGPGDGRIRLESWQNAQDQAIAAARSMLGDAAAYRPTPRFWTDQYDWNVQMIGLHDETVDQWVMRETHADKLVLIGLRNGVIVYALAVNQGGEVRALQRLIEQSIPVDPDRLSDMSLKLRQLERSVA
ncbi:pyridine nucleotide-disulfide oxidoreductase [Pandoraea anapnoica]|uniref:Pyridine nucleotide-disulfide oxidoreductase n=1 Tax=Pandoraea anapnoica TaxID=2508301 RepID=A0A5E4ZY61_9BURK|nr:FAD-dependent oxidoreductase [Pandoraea anapnoica]VVE65215.1 pyridine nucleotide-disulfide oxidoreductase [Pandoraea anapnoica]